MQEIPVRVSLLHLCGGFALFVTILSGIGCGGSGTNVVGGDAPAESGLQEIEEAYLRFIQYKKRGPKNLKELKPYFDKDVDVDKILISKRDGKPFVILWGANPTTSDSPEMIYAYEKEGKDGTRKVLTMSGIVDKDEDGFNASPFVNNHKP